MRKKRQAAVIFCVSLKRELHTTTGILREAEYPLWCCATFGLCKLPAPSHIAYEPESCCVVQEISCDSWLRLASAITLPSYPRVIFSALQLYKNGLISAARNTGQGKTP